MASIILKIDESVPHKDVDKIRLAIAANLKQQGVPVYMSYTDHICHFDQEVVQNDTPLDK